MMTTMEKKHESVEIAVDFGDGQFYTWVCHAMIDDKTTPTVTATTSDGRPVKFFTANES